MALDTPCTGSLLHGAFAATVTGSGAVRIPYHMHQGEQVPSMHPDTEKVGVLGNSVAKRAKPQLPQGLLYPSFLQ